ncbi:DUF1624 domain-containing protein [Candidatus Aenigmatarchaeota archaeon]
MERFWEIDTLRGIAIIKMILSNFIFDLIIFTSFSDELLTSFFMFPLASIIFMSLMGISLSISYSRVQNKGKKVIYKKYLRRGGKVFGLGLIITIITFLFLPEGMIWFGVLHFVGLGIILLIPTLRYKKAHLIGGIIIVIVGILLWGMFFDFPWLLWLGLKPMGFYTFDYFPVLPWIGVSMIGLFVGKTLYPGAKRKYNVPEVNNVVVRFFSMIGRKSLYIYLIHQPVLVGIIYLYLFLI